MISPPPPDVTRQLAYFAADLDFADLPPAVIAHGKLAILDGLGVILQGATLPWSRMVADLAIADGGRGEATILGRGVKVPAAAATLLSSLMIFTAIPSSIRTQLSSRWPSTWPSGPAAAMGGRP